MALILDSAYFFTGEELIDAVLKAFEIPNGVPDATTVEIQRQLIALIRATAKSANESSTLRIHGGDSFNVNQSLRNDLAPHRTVLNNDRVGRKRKQHPSVLSA